MPPVVRTSLTIPRNSFLDTAQRRLLENTQITQLDMVNFDNKRNPANEGVCMTLAPGSLPKVQSLDLSDAYISFDNLIVLLKAMPNIKQLRLDYVSFSGAISKLSLPFNSLPHLEHLGLSGVTISSTRLIMLLNAVPALKKLFLTKAVIQADAFLDASATDYPIPRFGLSEIYMNEMDSPIKVLQCLIQSAPNLQLLSSNNIKAELQYGLYFIFRKLVITTSQRYAKKRLADICLTGLSLPGQLVIPPDYRLAHTLYSEIGDIDRAKQAAKQMAESTLLVTSYFSMQTFADMLSQKVLPRPFTCIKFDFKTKNEKSPTFELKELPALFSAHVWTDLRSLDLCSLSLPVDQFRHILNATPNITHLYLNEFNLIESNNNPLVLNSLNGLNSIEVMDAKISREALKTLLLAAPNLCSLRFDTKNKNLFQSIYGLLNELIIEKHYFAISQCAHFLEMGHMIAGETILSKDLPRARELYRSIGMIDLADSITRKIQAAYLPSTKPAIQLFSVTVKRPPEGVADSPAKRRGPL